MLDRTGRKNHRNPSGLIPRWDSFRPKSFVPFVTTKRLQLGEDGLSSRIQETRLLLAEQKGNDEGGFHGNASFRSWSWFRRLSSTLRSTQQRIPTRRRESNDFAIIIARIHLACDSYQEYFSFHLLHWWQINVPDRNGRLVPSKIPNFWNYYVKHGFI